MFPFDLGKELALFLLFLTVVSARAPTKLIIDTDGVADDVRALSLALQHPQANVLAVTTVRGCATVTQAVANVARTMRANQKWAPIFKGAAGELVKLEKDWNTEGYEKDLFGKDGIGDAPNAFPKVKKEDFTANADEIAALALIRLTREHPDVTIVCLGPLTNIALALKLDPKFASQPKRIVIMGGNYYGMGNVRTQVTAEFNFHGDPEAAFIVLKEMQQNVTLVPWEAFQIEGLLNEKLVNFDANLRMNTNLSNFLATATRKSRELYAKNNKQFSYCDEIAVSVAIDPEAVISKTKVLRGSVELSGKFTRGQIAIDWTDMGWLEYTQKPITFVTSYNVEIVDHWLNMTTTDWYKQTLGNRK